MVNRKRAALIARLAASGNPGAAATRRPTNGTKIRAAQAADLDRVRDLCALAEVNLENEIVAAVEDGYAGATLRAGRTGGLTAFFSDVQETLPALSPDALRRLFLRLTLVLVAEQDQAGVIGAAVTFPPAGTIMKQLQWMQSVGASAESQMEVVLGGALRVSRVKAVGVDTDHRGCGIGADLVQASTAPFADLGYSMIYGIMPPRAGLTEFYGRLGFTVLPPGVPLSLEPAGVPAGVQPGPDERLFVRQY